jgi:2'-5' RNA ligase
MMDAAGLSARYDAIWERGWPAVAAGDVEIDTHLLAGADARRGMTLIARPDARLADYQAAVRAALEGTPPFAIDFTGVTVSPGAVLAQGYPRGPALEALRARLRAQLRARGLDDTLEQRYRIVTAHATLLRFVRPLADPAALAALLADVRPQPLGVLQARELELVVNDWHMSNGTLRLVERVALEG